MGLIIRLILGGGAIVAGWFVEADSPNFGVVQAMVGIGVAAVLLVVVAVWPKRWK